MRRRVRVDQHTADGIAYALCCGCLAVLIAAASSVPVRFMVMVFVSSRRWKGPYGAVLCRATATGFRLFDLGCCDGHLDFPLQRDCIGYPVGVYICHA